MKHCTNFVETIILKGSHDCPINLNGFDISENGTFLRQGQYIYILILLYFAFSSP
jgi:hypothetical protein